MAARAHHVEQTSHAVQGASHEQDCTFRSESCFAVALRVMGFNYPDALVHQALSRESHVHQCEVEFFCDIAVTARHQTHDAFKLGTKESVA